MGIEVPQMNILQIIATIFFGGSSILTIVTQGLYIIGLWKIFQKSDIKGWWALVPWFREYQLGKCAGKEPEGRAIGITAFLVCVTEIAGSFIKNEYVILAVAVDTGRTDSGPDLGLFRQI